MESYIHCMGRHCQAQQFHFNIIVNAAWILQRPDIPYTIISTKAGSSVTQHYSQQTTQDASFCTFEMSALIDCLTLYIYLT